MFLCVDTLHAAGTTLCLTDAMSSPLESAMDVVHAKTSLLFCWSNTQHVLADKADSDASLEAVSLMSHSRQRSPSEVTMQVEARCTTEP